MVPSSLHGSRTLKMKESVSIFLIQQTETKKIRERSRVENYLSLSAHGKWNQRNRIWGRNTCYLLQSKADLVVESSGYSCNGLGFTSQNPRADSKASVIINPKESNTSFWPPQAHKVEHIHTFWQNIWKKIKIFFSLVFSLVSSYVTLTKSLQNQRRKDLFGSKCHGRDSKVAAAILHPQPSVQPKQRVILHPQPRAGSNELYTHACAQLTFSTLR